MARKSSPRKPLQRAVGGGLNKLFKVTAPSTDGRLFGKGISGFLSGLISLILSLAISIIALVLISLVYTQIEAVAAEVTTLALASLSLGTVALALQVLGAIPAVSNWGGWLVSLIIMASYIIAGVLALLVATQVPSGSLQTYALIAGVFYVFIGGAYL